MPHFALTEIQKIEFIHPDKLNEGELFLYCRSELNFVNVGRVDELTNFNGHPRITWNRWHTFLNGVSTTGDMFIPCTKDEFDEAKAMVIHECKVLTVISILGDIRRKFDKGYAEVVKLNAKDLEYLHESAIIIKDYIGEVLPV